MTQTTLAVLRVFLDQPDKGLYGLEIGRAAGVRSGSLYPILDRLEQAGLLVGEWEDADPRSTRRPRRRYYMLTGQGVTVATAALRDAQERLIPRSWRPQVGGAAW
jgi:PadR family transcriptional regulator, regulatory protein PadR